MRTQQGLWLILPGLDVASAGCGAACATRCLARNSDGRRCCSSCSLGLVFDRLCGAGFAPQLLCGSTTTVASEPRRTPGRCAGATNDSGHALSMRAGLFPPGFPACTLCCRGCWLLWRRVCWAWLCRWRWAMFLAQLWVNAAVYDFHSSWAFGPRRGYRVCGHLCAGPAGLWQALSRRRMVLLVLSLCATLWNGLLIELVRTRRIKSSSSGRFRPRSGRWAGGPAWLGEPSNGSVFLYPACRPDLQPGVPRRPATFEGIIGNYPFERDNRYRARVLGQSIRFRGA